MNKPYGKPVQLVIGLMGRNLETMAKATRRLATRFGPVQFLSEPFEFELSSYYEPEMGPNLKKRLALFSEPVLQERLVPIKRICRSLENDFLKAGNRTINLDPGLLSPESFILASVKQAPHRICLTKGIYAETTLVFRFGHYQVLPWTYPDYARPEIRQILEDMRSRFLWQMKQKEA